MFIMCYVKGKGHPITGHQVPRGGVEEKLLLILNLSARRGRVVITTLGRFIPGKDPVPIVQEAGWAPGPVWMCAKNLAPTGIRCVMLLIAICIPITLSVYGHQ
jgi:hypothetical protein